mmetsp:Transcript_118004/g.341130  ORF Transcript_118004/g.341130 Transcript_118004/m.341130 type:complete len:384 (-) Transcript_118004:343-1494(-)
MRRPRRCRPRSCGHLGRSREHAKDVAVKRLHQHYSCTRLSTLPAEPMPKTETTKRLRRPSSWLPAEASRLIACVNCSTMRSLKPLPQAAPTDPSFPSAFIVRSRTPTSRSQQHFDNSSAMVRRKPCSIGTAMPTSTSAVTAVVRTTASWSPRLRVNILTMSACSLPSTALAVPILPSAWVEDSRTKSQRSLRPLANFSLLSRCSLLPSASREATFPMACADCQRTSLWRSLIARAKLTTMLSSMPLPTPRMPISPSVLAEALRTCDPTLPTRARTKWRTIARSSRLSVGSTAPSFDSEAMTPGPCSGAHLSKACSNSSTIRPRVATFAVSQPMAASAVTEALMTSESASPSACVNVCTMVSCKPSSTLRTPPILPKARTTRER